METIPKTTNAPWLKKSEDIHTKSTKPNNQRIPRTIFQHRRTSRLRILQLRPSPKKHKNKENITLFLPEKGLATQDKDKLRRPSDRKKNNKKKIWKRWYDLGWEKSLLHMSQRTNVRTKKKIHHLENWDKNNILRSKLIQLPIQRQIPINEDDNQSNNRLHKWFNHWN